MATKEKHQNTENGVCPCGCCVMWTEDTAPKSVLDLFNLLIDSEFPQEQEKGGE